MQSVDSTLTSGERKRDKENTPDKACAEGIPRSLLHSAQVHVPGEEVWKSSTVMPDPGEGEEGHYKPFMEVYGTSTTEQYVPSMMRKTQWKKTLAFASNLRHVKHVDMMLQCNECDSWRLLYSENKLSYQEWNGKTLKRQLLTTASQLQVVLPSKLSDCILFLAVCTESDRKLNRGLSTTLQFCVS